ncbi:MAG: exo-alpha-sialidase [Pelolinea sp.]|jgi:predicted neuraminidase|nr:exo-alpha-sialidase [Pelolinea sp.]
MNTQQIFINNNKYKSCHSVTLCKMKNGDLLAAWFAGDEEGSKNSVILTSRREKNKHGWLPASVTVNVVDRAAGNPRVFNGPDGGVWLLAPINYGKWCQGGTRLFVKRSYDYGRSWSDLELFVEPKGILGKNKPICTKADTWIVPCEYEERWQAVFLRLPEGRKEWEIIECPETNARLHQPTIIQKENGDLLAFMRTWEGVLYQTQSSDDGVTWTKPAATGIPNNNSGIDMVNLNGTNIALICNPCSLGKDGTIIVTSENRPDKIDIKELCEADSRQIINIIDPESSSAILSPSFPVWGPRSPLSILLSNDEGETWCLVADIETGPGEYSYPAVIQSAERQISIAYTANRKEIRYVEFEIPDSFVGKKYSRYVNTK